jgi:ferredoxin
MAEDSPTVTVYDGEDRTVLSAEHGQNLRELLCEHGCSPYTSVTSRLNCGGRGLCATCGVRLREDSVPPRHWHDRLAARFGYPRLSCQVTVEDDLLVELPDKLVWGSRDSEAEE